MTLWSVEITDTDQIVRVHPEIDKPQSWLQVIGNGIGLAVFIAAVIFVGMR